MSKFNTLVATLEKPKKSKWTKIEAKARLLIVVSCLSCISYISAFKWLEIQILNVNPVVHQTLKMPQGQTIIHQAEAKAVDPSKLNTEEYIAYKFGKDAKVALAVSQGENGTRQCDRTNWNTNKTTDYGIFMINSVHLKKGYKLADLIDCHTNIDIAYDIFKAQGWKPWVVYNTGAYKKFLK